MSVQDELMRIYGNTAQHNMELVGPTRRGDLYVDRNGTYYLEIVGHYARLSPREASKLVPIAEQNMRRRARNGR